MARLGRSQPAAVTRIGRVPLPLASVTLTDVVEKTVIQRASGVGSLTISGTHSGATSVEMRVLLHGTNTEVLGWATVDAAPGASTWSGTRSNIPQGGWYVFEIRPGNSPSATVRSTNRFGVGALIAGIGQSNEVKWFDTGTDVSPDPLLVQYTGSSGAGWAARGSTGNGANAFGNRIIAELGGNIPVALLHYGVGATALNSAGGGSGYWMNTAGGSPYDLFKAGVNSVGGKLEAVVFAQGEQDGYSTAVSEATYQSDLQTFIARIRTDFGQSSLKFIVVPLGRYTNAGPTNASWQGIKNAQRTVGLQTNNALAAPNDDLALADGVHFTAAAFTTHGTRAAIATAYALGLSSYMRGPSVASIVKASSTTVEVNLTHAGGTDFTPTSGITGIEVLGAGSVSTLTSAIRTTATKATFTASSALADPVTVRNLFGFNPTVSGLIVDNSTDALPLDGFAETAAATSNTASGVTLTATASLLPGAATGQSNATASGATTTVTASLIAGSATGQSNATAAGVTLTATASLIPGSASGTSAGTAAGITLTATASLIAGSASGASAGTANGQTLTATSSLVAGSASGQVNATAAGATITAAAGLIAGSASAANGGTASGTTVTAAASIVAGAASGTASATAPGATIAAAAALIAGAASAGGGAAVFRPTSDITAVGWTATPPGDLFDAIDEPSANDADYITSPPLSAATPATFGIGPLTAGTYKIRVRASTNFGAGTLRVKLLDSSGTTLATSADQSITSTPTTFEPEVTIAVGTATRVSIEVAA